VSEYLLKYFPYEDLIIYEVGAGNGTLATNILDFIRERHPDVYERTRYRIIEISKALSDNQQRALRHHSSVVEVINKSIFDWTQREWAPCFFLALEVIVSFYLPISCPLSNQMAGQLPARRCTIPRAKPGAVPNHSGRRRVGRIP